MSSTERVARLRSDLHAAEGREAALSQHDELSEDEKKTLERLRGTIPMLRGALAEAESRSLTGDGEARP